MKPSMPAGERAVRQPTTSKKPLFNTHNYKTPKMTILTHSIGFLLLFRLLLLLLLIRFLLLLILLLLFLLSSSLSLAPLAPRRRPARRSSHCRS